MTNVFPLYNFTGPIVRKRHYADRFFAFAVALFMLTFSTACTFGVDQVLSDIDLVLQTSNVVCSTLGIVAPADAAACQGIAAVAIAGITVIKTAYDDYKANPGSGTLANVVAALNAVKTNLPAELQAAHIVNPVAVQVVTAWVNFVVSTVSTIAGLIPQLTASSKAISTRKSTFSLPNAFPSPESLKARWDAEVCNNQIACTKLVKVHHVRHYGPLTVK